MIFLLSMNSENDTIIIQFSRGEEVAFNKLFRIYYPALCFFGERMGVERFIAEEVAQDAFLTIWKKRENFDKEKAFKVYLYITVRNACLKHLQKEKRYTGHLDTFAENADGLQLPHEFELIETDMFQVIYTAIDRLPEQCGKILRMSYIYGKKNQQIAIELAISEQTVKNQKVKALKLLKGILTRDELAIFLLYGIFFIDRLG